MPARRALGSARRPALGAPVALGVLLAVCLLSLALGALPLSPAAVWRGLSDPASPGYLVVHEMRLPRTLLGLLAGTALGLAGAVMQALTRNPLADPGLLGVNAGASAAVVTATALFGISSLGGYALLLGAALMEWADYLSQHAIPDRVLPVGVVTGVLGGGYLAYLLAGHPGRVARSPSH